MRYSSKIEIVSEGADGGARGEPLTRGRVALGLRASRALTLGDAVDGSMVGVASEIPLGEVPPSPRRRRSSVMLLVMCVCLMGMGLGTVSCLKQGAVKEEDITSAEGKKDDWTEIQSGAPAAEKGAGGKGFQSASGVKISERAVEEMNRAVRLMKKSGMTPQERAEAQHTLQDLVRQEPQFVEARINLGLTYELAGSDSEAQAQYEEALRQANRYVPACTRMASLLSKQGDSSRALSILSPCLEQSKGAASVKDPALLAEGLVVQAALKWAQGKKEDTLKDLGQALYLYPETTSGLVLRADIHRSQGECVQAKGIYERVLRDKSLKNPAQAYNNLALCEWELKYFTNAVSAWEKSQSADSSLPDPYYHLGRVALENGDFKKAEQNLSNLTRLKPKDASAHVLLGIALRGMGNYPGAEKEYQEALRLDARHPEALLNLAVLYHKFMKDPMKGLAYYERFSNADSRGAQSKEVQALVEEARRESKRGPAASPTTAEPAAAEKEQEDTKPKAGAKEKKKLQ